MIFVKFCAIGYNGNFKGGANERDSNVTGQSGFLHSEENALLHLTRPFETRNNLIIMCTHKPCAMCAKRIVNSGIKTVYFFNDYIHAGPTETIFKQANVLMKRV